MRCCGNCEWSVSSLCEEEMIIEYDYELDEQTIPKMGDCLLSIDHNGNYVCREHNYIENGIRNYFLYDDSYLGPGYFIITEYYGEIVKFIKLYQTGNEFPSFAVRGYELYHDGRENIQIDINESNTINKELVAIISDFVNKINSGTLVKNKLKILENEDGISIILKRDESLKDYANVFLGNYDSCRYYKEISLLFRNLAWESYNRTDENVVKKILKISR